MPYDHVLQSDTKVKVLRDVLDDVQTFRTRNAELLDENDALRAAAKELQLKLDEAKVATTEERMRAHDLCNQIMAQEAKNNRELIEWRLRYETDMAELRSQLEGPARVGDEPTKGASPGGHVTISGPGIYVVRDSDSVSGFTMESYTLKDAVVLSDSCIGKGWQIYRDGITDELTAFRPTPEPLEERVAAIERWVAQFRGKAVKVNSSHRPAPIGYINVDPLTNFEMAQ